MTEHSNAKQRIAGGPFIRLLTEVPAVGALFSTARQELEVLQQPKDAQV